MTIARRQTILFGTLAALLLAIAGLLVLGARQRARDDARNLDAILVFTDPAECRTGQPLTRMVHGMIAFDPETVEARAGPPIAVPGFAEPLRPRLQRRLGVGRDAIGFLSHAIIDLRGHWYGLKVVALRSGSEDDFEIQFAERPARVHAVLQEAGFPLPPVGEWTRPDYSGPGRDLMMSLQSEDGGATLYCSR